MRASARYGQRFTVTAMMSRAQTRPGGNAMPSAACRRCHDAMKRGHVCRTASGQELRALNQAYTLLRDRAQTVLFMLPSSALSRAYTNQHNQ